MNSCLIFCLFDDDQMLLNFFQVWTPSRGFGGGEGANGRMESLHFFVASVGGLGRDALAS